MLSFASMLTIFVSMVILGASFFFMVNANYMASTFESQLEVSAFLNQDITPEDIERVRGLITVLPEVASVELVTKDQALAQFGQNMGANQSEIIEDLGGVNPLPDKFTIKTTDPQQVITVAQQVETITGVKKVRYGPGVVEPLLKFTQWLRWIGVGIVILFTVASLVLISINIKLNVFSRRREIQIMKLVGASDTFIRWPFLIEGMIIGMIGGILAALTVGYGYNWLVEYLTMTLTFLPVVHNAVFFGEVLTGLILAGMLIGALGSTFSVRKYLRI
jgi:cell division transport system permease protein